MKCYDFCYMTCVSRKALCKHGTLSSFSGLWIAADDIQGLCGIAAEIPWQASSHVFLFRCHHARGESVGKWHRPLSSLKESPLGLAVWFYSSPFCWAYDFTKISFYFQLFKFIFLVGNLPKFFFFWTVVHGLKDSLHRIGDLNNSACKIYQWCAPAARRGGGEDSWVLNHLKNGIKNLVPYLSQFKVHTQLIFFVHSGSMRFQETPS